MFEGVAGVATQTLRDRFCDSFLAAIDDLKINIERDAPICKRMCVRAINEDVSILSTNPK